MTAVSRKIMEKWKADKQWVIVCSQSGQKEHGYLLDYDDEQIVLEKEVSRSENEQVICCNYFSVKAYSSYVNN